MFNIWAIFPLKYNDSSFVLPRHKTDDYEKSSRRFLFFMPVGRDRLKRFANKSAAKKNKNLPCNLLDKMLLLYIMYIYNNKRIGMNIFLSNLSGKSLYEQIYEQIKQQILEGTLSAGAALPTIRGLAKDLKISVITTARAYSDLERDGFIYSVVGKGSFVSERNQEFVSRQNRSEMRENIQKAVQIARRMNMTRQDFREFVEEVAEGEQWKD